MMCPAPRGRMQIVFSLGHLAGTPAQPRLDQRGCIPPKEALQVPGKPCVNQMLPALDHLAIVGRFLETLANRDGMEIVDFRFHCLCLALYSSCAACQPAFHPAK